jgi:hypothetical protein
MVHLEGAARVETKRTSDLYRGHKAFSSLHPSSPLSWISRNPSSLLLLASAHRHGGDARATVSTCGRGFCLAARRDIQQLRGGSIRPRDIPSVRYICNATYRFAGACAFSMRFVQCSRHLSAVLSQDVEQGSSLLEQVLVPLDQALSHGQPRYRDFCRLKSSLRIDSSIISFLLPPSPPTLDSVPSPPLQKNQTSGMHPGTVPGRGDGAVTCKARSGAGRHLDFSPHGRPRLEQRPIVAVPLHLS